MTNLLYLTLILTVLGFVGAAIKASPIFAGVRLLVGLLGVVLMIPNDSSYIGMIVFFIYLRGMLVVFGYTSAKSTDEYPETWGSNLWLWFLLLLGILLEVILVITVLHFERLGVGGLYNWDSILAFGEDNVLLVREDSLGVAAKYSYGSWITVVGGWTLQLFILLKLLMAFS